MPETLPSRRLVDPGRLLIYGVLFLFVLYFLALMLIPVFWPF